MQMNRTGYQLLIDFKASFAEEGESNPNMRFFKKNQTGEQIG
jgi:hypothetical protein